VYLFQDGHVLLGRAAPQPAQARDGVIHPLIACFWRFRHDPFGIMVLIFIARILR
jgi:hypothetical protein